MATPERRALAESVSRFTADRIAPHLTGWESEGALPRHLHRQAAELGLLGVGYPESVGGSGGDLADVCVLTEALIEAGGSGGVMAGLFTHGIAIPHIIDSGDQRLIEAYVRPVLAGDKIACLAVTEPDGGSDVANLRTHAEQRGGQWVVNGAKTYITSGARADVAVVAARVGQPGAAGIALFAVDTHQPGFRVSGRLAKMGWHCSDTAEIGLVDAQADVITLDGFGSLARHFATERLSLGITGYATAARCLHLTRQWITERSTFGRPLATRQVVRHTVVEMHRQVEVARTYTHSLIAAGEVSVLDAVLAKKTGVDCAAFVTDRAVQLLGGFGYMRDGEVERHYRDARILGIGGGADEVMSDLAARLIGL